MSQRFVRLETARQLFWKALEHGGDRVSLTHVHWHVGAHCTAPVALEVVGRGDLLNYRMAVNPGYIRISMFGLPCRKCAPCLRVRAARWTQRAMTEIARAPGRTWFCTFTLHPDWQHQVFMEEMALKTAVDPKRPGKGGWLDTDFDDPAKEFLLRCHGGLRLMTKYWKNLRKPQAKRKEEPVSLKYLLVAEKHKSGLPHYHALVHEQTNPIRWTRLNDRWEKYGHFYGVLAGDSGIPGKVAAQYVNKLTRYVSKDMLCRVRASQRYGLLMSASSLLDQWEEAGVASEKATLSPYDSFIKLLEKSNA